MNDFENDLDSEEDMPDLIRAVLECALDDLEGKDFQIGVYYSFWDCVYNTFLIIACSLLVGAIGYALRAAFGFGSALPGAMAAAVIAYVAIVKLWLKRHGPSTRPRHVKTVVPVVAAVILIGISAGSLWWFW